MAKRTRFSPEVRERAVRLVQEHRADYETQWGAITSIASKIECAAGTLRQWLRRSERDRGSRPGATTAAPPAEKRTQITSAFKQEKVEEVTNVNFNLSIGTAVPAGVRYHPLPSRIVEIYPEWRGYDFILVRGKYFVLRPHSHEIVYIIEG